MNKGKWKVSQVQNYIFFLVSRGGQVLVHWEWDNELDPPYRYWRLLVVVDRPKDDDHFVNCFFANLVAHSWIANVPFIVQLFHNGKRSISRPLPLFWSWCGNQKLLPTNKCHLDNGSQLWRNSPKVTLFKVIHMSTKDSKYISKRKRWRYGGVRFG